MSVTLSTRVKKLETAAGVTAKTWPKVVRLVTNDADEAEAKRLAREAGYDDGPDNTDILIIRLVAMAPREPDEQPA